jgi:REP element-mobilizing transposase RayT
MKWRKSIRLRNYNYRTDGYYFVTICTACRKPFLEQYRTEAEQVLMNLPLRFPGLRIDFYIIMPDHAHVIIILENSDASLSQIIRTYKALVTKTSGYKPFWERNFYEHIIRNEKALCEIRKYIQENPDKEMLNFENIYRRLNATATNKLRNNES